MTGPLIGFYDDIDTIVNEIVGVKPVNTVRRIAGRIGPASFMTRVLKAPTPQKVIDDVGRQASNTLAQLERGPRF